MRIPSLEDLEEAVNMAIETYENGNQSDDSLDYFIKRSQELCRIAAWYHKDKLEEIRAKFERVYPSCTSSIINDY